MNLSESIEKLENLLNKAIKTKMAEFFTPMLKRLAMMDGILRNGKKDLASFKAKKAKEKNSEG